MNAARNERGQVFVLSAVIMTALVGMTALVLDVGSWFRGQRQLQATADAAALAGAQALPDSTNTATQWALSYANDNGGGVLAADVTFNGSNQISVVARKQSPGFFSRIFGINLVDVNAKAVARVDSPQQAKYVAPMVVSCAHDLIQNCDGKHVPKFNKETTLNFDPMGAPGAFGMLNLDGGNGTPGSSDEANWILHGFNKYLDLGDYRSDPGAKFSSQNILGALDDRVGTVLLFPVFRTLDQQGQNATYDIIGWIGFHLDSYVAHGNNATLTGYFTTFIAQGILADQGSGSPPSFGVKSIQLIQ
jgi:Putative Flp pilus-assembly TadE/G-like